MNWWPGYKNRIEYITGRFGKRRTAVGSGWLPPCPTQRMRPRHNVGRRRAPPSPVRFLLVKSKESPPLRAGFRYGLDWHYIKGPIKRRALFHRLSRPFPAEHKRAGPGIEETVGRSADDALAKPSSRCHGRVAHEASSSRQGHGRMVRCFLMRWYVGQEQ